MVFTKNSSQNSTFQTSKTAESTDIYRYTPFYFITIFLQFFHILIVYLSIKHSIPGNFFPSKNSKDAPPPVDICVILSSKPAFFTAAAESPPPIIVVASISANTFAISLVPIANWSNSNNPKGPFHTTVLAFFNSSLNILIVSCPISKPSQSAGISVHYTVLASTFSPGSFAITVSNGRINLTPFCFAFSIKSFAKPNLSNSQIDFPTSYPCALKKV